MGKYENDSKLLIEYIGGKENVSTVAHCATRMRFVLNNPEKADIKKIETIKSVKGTFTQAGQFQVIIGNDVQEFFNDFSKNSGIEGVNKDQAKSDAKKNMSVLQRVLAALAEIFSPLIPAIVVGGLILGFRNIIGEIKLLENGTMTIASVSQFWSGVNHFLWLIGEAVFHFLPVGITWSITKKMGTTQILGIVLGITLVSPQLLNAYGVASADVIPYWDFGFTKINMIGYQAQVLPAILAGFMLAYLEIGLRKIIPNAISMIFVPFFALVPTVLAAHSILGPIGWSIGTALSNVVYAGLTSSLSWLFAGIFGFLYAPLVITGLHHMSNAIDLQLMSQFQGTNLWPMIALSNIAQGSAVLAVIFLHRGDKDEEQVSIPATISCYLGVTEPAMFGINLKFLYPFVAGMIGSSIAAIISVSNGVMANSIGVGGIPGILSIKPEYWFVFSICMIVTIIVPFFLTIIFRKYNILNKVDTKPIGKFKENNVANEINETKEDNIIYSAIKGTVKSLSEVNDSAFSSGVLGKGVAIDPTEGKVFSPVDGELTVLFPTGHAIGILSKSGVEILIHIGMDTVKLEGRHFIPHVKTGDKIKAGDLLVEFDIEAIKAEGYDMITPIIISNTEKYNDIIITDKKTTEVGNKLMIIKI